MTVFVRIVAIAAAWFLGPVAGGAAQDRVRTDSLFAPSLQVSKHFRVYIPPSYSRDATRRFPVLFYLHGLWGDESNWIERGGLAAVADSLAAAGHAEAIIVMPDGDDGFYRTWEHRWPLAECATTRPVGFNQSEAAESYCVGQQRYDAYIVTDLVAYVDATYRTLAGSATRGIGGLSMGGYGAITLALRYPDVFGAAASHSGVVSLLLRGPAPFDPPATYAAAGDDLEAAMGQLWPLVSRVFGTTVPGWRRGDPAQLASARVPDGRLPSLFLDVGTDDPYVDQSRALHSELERLGIVHTYAEWPGSHTWRYWRSHVGESLSWLLERVQSN